jgi:DNA gyrase/topoisomerase IV subunit B
LIFEKGHAIFTEITSGDHTEDFTKISFEMSKEIFGDLTFDINDLQSRINILKEKLPNLKMGLYKL